MIQKNSKDYPNLAAQYSKDAAGVFKTTTFAELYREMLAFAAGLRETGIKRGDHVGFISDNRKEWLVADLGLHCLGAADVPRGCDSMAQELAYILSFGDCKSAILENEAQLVKILSHREKMPQLKTIILIDNDFDKKQYAAQLSGIRVLGFTDILEQGKALTAKGTNGVQSIEEEIEQGKTDDLATIIFTSGTTGEPKGVMLTHKNFLHQSSLAPIAIDNRAGDIWLTVLPVWHSFERVVQYICLHPGGALAYSKPVGSIMLADCQKIRPTYMTSVPRIWEALRTGMYRNAAAGGKEKILNLFVTISSVHQKMKNMLLGRIPQFTRRFVPLDMLVSFIPFLVLLPLRGLGNALVFKKIKNMLGGRLKAAISGGGSLPEAVDNFFAAAGVNIIEGYGLTEAAPVLAVRHIHHPVPGTIGPAFPEMDVVIRDPDTGKEVPYGQKGILFARGAQIMQGYYKKPEETKKVIDAEGWLNTGDIGLKTCKGEIKLTGRAKDTIVLLGGENIEPVPLENKIRESKYISHAVVLGQDQKYLAALVVPNFEQIEAYAKENAIPYMDLENLTKLHEIRELIHREITELVSRKTGFRGFEMIFRSAVLSKAFEPGVELSGKQDYKRHVIADMYKKEISALFAE